MIKLIATDIDGTLLTAERRHIKLEFFAEAERLMDKGVIFSTSSGRQYHSLRSLFGPIKDRIYYICENGAVIYGQGEKGAIISKTVIDREVSLKLCREILSHNDCELLVSGADMSYVFPKGNEIVDEMTNYVGNKVTVLSSPEEMPEDFIKISARCSSGAAGLEKIMAPEWSDRFSVAVAAETWLDFTIADKGTGISALCDHLGISLADTIAFGDNFNDTSILDIVGHPYIMSSGAPELQQRYKNHCENVEDVLKMM